MQTIAALLLPIILYYNVFVLVYFFSLNLFYLLLFSLAFISLLKYKRLNEAIIKPRFSQALLPSISIIAPAYNEQLTIEESVNALRNIDYPDLQIILVNDGSTDATLDILKEKLSLFRCQLASDNLIITNSVKSTYRSAKDERIIVIDKVNGRKADSLNSGLNYCKSRLFCAIDSDSLIEKNALKHLVQPYLERDSKVVALGGIVRVANNCIVKDSEIIEARVPKNALATFQTIEYIRAFLCGRTGWNALNSLLIVSGAFGLFETKTVINIGGYDTHSLGEDMELVVRLHKTMIDKNKNYKVIFVPDPVCWTQVPEDLATLASQRIRWQRGLLEIMIKHKDMIFNPKYRLDGLLAMPYFLFYELIGPVVETTGYFVTLLSFIMGWINLNFALLFLLFSVLFGIMLSLIALLLEEFTVRRYQNPRDIMKLFLFAILENLGYRQINSWWRLLALIQAFTGKKSGWGVMPRKSFSS